VETTSRPIIITPLVGLTPREWLIIAEAVRDAENATAERLMAEREQATPTAAPKQEQTNA